MSGPLYSAEYSVLPMDFVSAGNASSSVRKSLIAYGLDSDIVRRAAISAYEAEMNIVIHGGGGKLVLKIYADYVKIEAIDNGPGISDLALAMQEGFTTAGDEIREMGFGAGLGLPNIQRCVNHLGIKSRPGLGTRATMRLDIKSNSSGG